MELRKKEKNLSCYLFLTKAFAELKLHGTCFAFEFQVVFPADLTLSISFGFPWETGRHEELGVDLH